jgi:hypothetical protein
MGMFFSRFYNFNIFKDIFRIPGSPISVSNYCYNYKDNIIFFRKSSYFVFVNAWVRSTRDFNFIYIVRLFLKGVGYKVLQARKFSKILIYRFELGFSVVRYLCLPNTSFFKHRKDRVIIFGVSKDSVVRNAKLISSLKVPDVYKGKGVRDAAYLFQPKPGKQRLVFSFK